MHFEVFSLPVSNIDNWPKCYLRCNWGVNLEFVTKGTLSSTYYSTDQYRPINLYDWLTQVTQMESWDEILMVVGNDAKHYQFQNKEIVSVNCEMCLSVIVSCECEHWMKVWQADLIKSQDNKFQV